MFKVDQNYMRRDRDGSFDGRLDMRNHRISGLADPTDAYDAVTMRYVASRFQALSDEVQDKKSKLDALQNFLGVVNNQVLIRVHDVTDADFSIYITSEEERNIGILFSFRKHALKFDDIYYYNFFDMFTLKEYFVHLFEEPADDVTWLRIEQPGTYTIHFDLIRDSSSFSFELHTRDEVILFTEHNPKRNIN